MSASAALFSKAAVAADSNAKPSFCSLMRLGPIEQRQLQPVDLQQVSASNSCRSPYSPALHLEHPRGSALRLFKMSARGHFLKVELVFKRV
jgi:hypothetical protein